MPTLNKACFNGFALLEILLALVLAVAVLGTALPALATTAARLQDFRTTSKALALANAKLTEFKHMAVAAQPIAQGQEGAFFWQINITNLSLFPDSLGTRQTFQLQELVVRVALQAQDLPLIELKTHRIEPLQ